MGVDPLKTLGIDLSADPAKTGGCAIDWDAGTVRLLPRPLHDEPLVEAALQADMAAIDVPLGWPDQFIDALVAHRDGAAWPPLTALPPDDRVRLRFRTTDLLTREGGAQPLSVSSDRIGVAAMRGARIQHLLLAAGVSVDRSGTTGRVLEAYPAAALRVWGLPSSKYKGSPNVEACSALAAALAEQCGHLGPAVSDCLDACDDDGLDAFVCALVGRAALIGQTTRPSEGDLDIARREGWIHVPTAQLADIIGSS